MVNCATPGHRKGNGAGRFVNHEVTTGSKNRDFSQYLTGTFQSFHRTATLRAKLIGQRIDRFNYAQQFDKGVPFIAALNQSCGRRVFFKQGIQITT